MHELGSIDVMRLDQTLGQSRHVACSRAACPVAVTLACAPKSGRRT